MPSDAILLALILMLSLTGYALLGGADYGGGVWDLLARGPRARQQRDLIAHAIGPIWEANHVWLILVVVVLFTAFPAAFALIATALHIPLALMLVGIVLRGSAFTFRTYDASDDRVQQRWGRAFAIASLITPILLGVIVGALSSGLIQPVAEIRSGAYFFTWFAPFPFAVGLFAVVLFAFLAATYLTADTDDPALQDDFRLRAMVTELLAGGLALVVFLLAGSEAPAIRENLARSWWTWYLQLATAAMAVAVLWSLWTRRFRLARLFAPAQVTLILWGWGLAQFPYLVRPTLTIEASAGAATTMRFLLWALLAGALLLFPSYWYLFRVFKGEVAPQAPTRS